MKIYKFGGASIKDADSIRNVEHVLRTVGYSDTLLVVSAMGKTTNAFELVIKAYLEHSSEMKVHLDRIKDYHLSIVSELFGVKADSVTQKVNRLFDDLNIFFTNNRSTSYNFVYDQIIGYGELIATAILSEYLNFKSIENTRLDVREFIKTDRNYRDAKVDWQETERRIRKIDPFHLYIVQGFLGSDEDNFTTSLGREGSDYTAGIFGYCLDAECVAIWKDVPGVLNADPRYFKDTLLLRQVPYDEAIELAFYGASVIHPKTLQPLQRKQIPLLVKSFVNPKEDGTSVCNVPTLTPQVPCFILKKNQVALALSTRDFSFMVEDNISKIFKFLHQYKMKVDMVQNSAISFYLCIDDKFGLLQGLLDTLAERFEVSCYKNVSLYTILHATEEAVASIQKEKKPLLIQRFQNTVQIVMTEDEK